MGAATIDRQRVAFRLFLRLIRIIGEKSVVQNPVDNLCPQHTWRFSGLQAGSSERTYGLSHDGPGGGGTNAEDVGEGGLDALLVRDVNTANTSGLDNQARAAGHGGGLGALARGREGRSLEAYELLNGANTKIRVPRSATPNPVRTWPLGNVKRGRTVKLSYKPKKLRFAHMDVSRYP
eukprot:132970-Pyramimonas_sp.AAC.1